VSASGRDWSIRGAIPRDAPAVSEVARAAWRNTYGALIDAERIERFLTGAYSEASVRRRIEIADRFDVALARGDTAEGESPGADRVIGFAEWALRGTEAELVATYLLPGWQRLGIGRALHARAVVGYRGRIERLTVQLLRDNLDARAFYESLGYGQPVVGEWQLFGLALPDLRLTLPLAAADDGGGGFKADRGGHTRPDWLS